VATNNAEAEARDPASVLSHYRALIALRNAYPSLSRGDWIDPRVDGLVLSVQRRWKDERTVVVTNYGPAAARATVGGLPPGQLLRRIFPAVAASDKDLTSVFADVSGTARLPVAPQSVSVYRLE
jgi:glycosidase